MRWRMARIKSAWEIALEKTADIELDEEKYKAETILKEGMALAGKYLNNPDFTEKELKASYKEELKDGVKNVIFSNIALPVDDSYKMRFERTSDLVGLLDKSGEALPFMKQIGEFMGQYLAARKEFADKMKQQIKQAMEENPQQVNSAQYTQMIEQKLKQMETQYFSALENSKNTLREMLEN